MNVTGGPSMDRGPESARRNKYMGIGVVIGIAIGAGPWLSLDNLALGIAIGSGVGVALGGRSRGAGRRR